MPTISQSTSGSPSILEEFKVPEFELYDRGIVWYILILFGFSGLIVIAIKLNDLRLAFLCILAAVIFYQLALVNPKLIRVTVTTSGLLFKKKYYPWTSFRSGTFFGGESHMTVHLDPLSVWAGPVVVPLPGGAEQRAKFIALVGRFVPEKIHSKMTVADWIVTTLRF